MPIERDEKGVIINAEDLVVDQVVHDRVLCPACHEKVFARWPLGWDAHSKHVCTGIEGNDGEARKTWFRQNSNYLFR